jgi:hypothetical protein
MKRAADIRKKALSCITLTTWTIVKGRRKLMYDEFKDRIYIKHLYGPLFLIYITFSNSK